MTPPTLAIDRFLRVEPEIQRRSDVRRDYSAATICWMRHWPSSARSEAGFSGLFSTAMFSSRAAARTCGLRSAGVRGGGAGSPERGPVVADRGGAVAAAGGGGEGRA